MVYNVVTKLRKEVIKMKRGHKQFFVRAYEVRTLQNGCPYGRTVDIGNASSLKSAKSMISKYRRENQEYEPQDFEVFDCWAEVDKETGFVPCVYKEK